ncbi:hypothetical protein J6590_067460 [Homalodisca vitripennis]|nr:hypothetical protein J6590_067460 [Homalodisca vitripennis]
MSQATVSWVMCRCIRTPQPDDREDLDSDGVDVVYNYNYDCSANTIAMRDIPFTKEKKISQQRQETMTAVQHCGSEVCDAQTFGMRQRAAALTRTLVNVFYKLFLLAVPNGGIDPPPTTDTKFYLQFSPQLIMGLLYIMSRKAVLSKQNKT